MDTDSRVRMVLITLIDTSRYKDNVSLIDGLDKVGGHRWFLLVIQTHVRIFGSTQSLFLSSTTCILAKYVKLISG